MPKRGIVLWLCVIALTRLGAQNTIDTSFIRPFTDRPQLTFEFAQRNQKIDLVNPANEKQKISYEPNNRINFITSFDYRWLSLSLGLFSFDGDDGAQKGSTQQFALRFSINSKRVWNSNFLQLYNGYYLSNPQEIPQWVPAQNSFPIRPDISTLTWFSNIYYCFSPSSFSYRAALWQLERQEKSAGSFLAGASYRFNWITSDESTTMIPAALYSDYAEANRAVAVQQSTLAFHAGYVHTFVARKYWYFTVFFMPGLAVENGFYKADDLIQRSFESELAAAAELRLVGGYNGDRFFCGMSGHSITYSGTRKADLWVNTSTSTARLFAGYRFQKVDRTKGPKLLRFVGL